MTTAEIKKLCSQIPWCDPTVLEATIELALEIAREGREGRRIGTIFTVGNSEVVLAESRALILDPLLGHTPARTHITDPNLRGTIKELAQLDGAFVIAQSGAVVAACRYLDASVEQIDLPLGLGSRHLAAASMSQRLGVVAVVVSESGVVRVFHGGHIEATFIPELWLLERHRAQLSHAQAGDRRSDDLEPIFPLTTTLEAMDKLATDTSIRDLLKAVASAEEAHSAVSVAAVAGAFGTSLILRVAALPQTRVGSAGDWARLIEASVTLVEIQEQLLETVETETAVKVFAARNMPQASTSERSDRQAAIQLALRAAADVPLEVMRLSASGLKQAQVVAAHSSRAAAADVHLGAALLPAAFDGVRSNLEGKLTSLTGPHHVTFVVDEIARLSEEVAGTTRATESLLRVPPV